MILAIASMCLVFESPGSVYHDSRPIYEGVGGLDNIGSGSLGGAANFGPKNLAVTTSSQAPAPGLDLNFQVQTLPIRTVPALVAYNAQTWSVAALVFASRFLLHVF